MKPACLGSLPALRWRPGEREPLVSDEARATAPALAEDLAVLDGELLPTFYELDETALRAQNTFRLGQLFVIVGGAVATSLGAIQAGLGGGVTEIGVAEALVAGTLAAGISYVRGRHAQQEYFTTRLKAERLRGEYFRFLGRLEPYGADEDRLQRLREQVRRIATTAGT